MSETVRTYTFSEKRRRRGRGRRGGCGCLSVIILIALLAGLGWWLTRDTHDAGDVIPLANAYNVAFIDILENRAPIAESLVWNGLPFDPAKSVLAAEPPVPEWVMNNLVGHVCYLSGKSLQEPDGVMLVTKMSHLGRLLELLHPVLPHIQRDSAGGLGLRVITNGESKIFYAVRGRLLVASTSRDALVTALTLQDQESLGQQALATALEASGPAQVRGMLRLRPGDPAYGYFDSVSFALRVDASTALLKCRGATGPAWKERWGPLLRKSTPGPLKEPVKGLVELSFDVDQPLDKLLFGLGTAMGIEPLTEEAWDDLETAWIETDPDKARSLRLLRGALGTLGPAVTLSLVGVDQYAILPMPELILTAAAKPGMVEGAFQALPAPSEGTPPWATVPRYEPEAQLVRLPLPGGPSLEPIFGIYGDALLVSTSDPLGRELLRSPARPGELATQGNVYLRVEPEPLVSAVTEAGRQFCAHDLLKGYTEETFEKSAERWMTQAHAIREVTLLAALGESAVSLDLTVAAQP